MFCNTTQYLGFSFQGSEKMRIDSLGNASIGTTYEFGRLNIAPAGKRSGNTTAGAVFDALGGVVVDTITTTSGTQSQVVSNSFGQNHYKAVNTGVTHTLGTTVYIVGPPIADTNVTITNPLSLYIGSGQ